MKKLDSGTEKDLYAIWGSATQIVIAGAEATLLYSQSGDAPWQQEATPWNSLPEASKPDLEGLWGDDSGTLVVVGEGGAIAHKGASDLNWVAKDPSTRTHLKSVWGQTAKHIVYAASRTADGRGLLHRIDYRAPADPQVSEVQTLPSSVPARALSGVRSSSGPGSVNEREVFLVGDQGSILISRP